MNLIINQIFFNQIKKVIKKIKRKKQTSFTRKQKLKEIWAVSLKVFLPIIWCKNNKRNIIKGELDLKYNLTKYTIISLYTQGFKFFVYEYIQKISSLAYKCIMCLKEWGKVWQGFQLIYCGTFIVYKWKKVPLEFTQWFAIGSH